MHEAYLTEVYFDEAYSAALVCAGWAGVDGGRGESPDVTQPVSRADPAVGAGSVAGHDLVPPKPTSAAVPRPTGE